MSRDEAIAMLAQHALTSLWMASDFQPAGEGCCAVCCAPCAALLALDEAGQLDEVLAAWPDGIQGSDMFEAGEVDRVWMYRQWRGPLAQLCGHVIGARFVRIEPAP